MFGAQYRQEYERHAGLAPQTAEAVEDDTTRKPITCAECPDPNTLPCLACYTRAGYPAEKYEAFKANVLAQKEQSTTPAASSESTTEKPVA